MTTRQSVGYHSIVALFSPSETSQPAALRAANIAEKLNSQVTLAHIAFASDQAHENDQANDSQIRKLMTENPEIVLLKRTRGSLLAFIPMTNEVSGDLIVLDAGMQAQLQPILLESRETACDQGACDALVVHGAKGENDSMDYRHIVVAADLNDQALMTIYKAVRMAKRYHARLTLLNVLNTGTGKADTDAAKELRLRGLEAFAAVIEGLDVEKAVLAASDTVGQAVGDYCARHNVDLIVVGSHKFHGLCVLLGNTAKGVIEAAQCDVLVVHE